MLMILNDSEKDLSVSELTGRRIKRTLEIEGIRQTDFFGELGIKKPTYTKWLTGENGISSIKLVAIAEKLGCSTDFLLGLSPVATKSTGGIMALLNRIGFNVETDPEREDKLIISQGACSSTYSVDELNYELEFILYCLIMKRMRGFNMINTTAIRNRMIETGITNKMLAKKWNISEELACQKTAGLDPLTLDQAETMQKELGISDADFGKYFFA